MEATGRHNLKERMADWANPIYSSFFSSPLLRRDSFYVLVGLILVLVVFMRVPQLFVLILLCVIVAVFLQVIFLVLIRCQKMRSESLRARYNDGVSDQSTDPNKSSDKNASGESSDESDYDDDDDGNGVVDDGVSEETVSVQDARKAAEQLESLRASVPSVPTNAEKPPTATNVKTNFASPRPVPLRTTRSPFFIAPKSATRLSKRVTATSVS